VDFKTGELVKSESAYEHPQPHACFIQGVRDDLVGDGGIMDLWVREARLFKYGSGTGSNFSAVRGENEKLSGGGKSSGLLSFLKIGDRAAGAIKSGGTTRRAAKMVTVDLDHPDIEAYIDWKVVEEQKVASLVAGSNLAAKHMTAVMQVHRLPVRHGPVRCRLRLLRRRGWLQGMRLRPGSQEEPGSQEGDHRGPQGDDPRKLYPARDSVRRPGLHVNLVQELRHGLGFGSLQHGFRPELEQLGPHSRCLHQGGPR
jgi:hypothetical protein